VSDGRCIFEGTFGDIHIPDVLTFLDMLGKTGTLEVRNGEDSRHLYLDDGELIFADSSLGHETLPGWLLRNGRISKQAMEDARANATDETKIVAELVKMGELDPSSLPASLRGLVLDIIYGLFDWEEGTFQFFLTAQAHGEKVVLRTSASNIIMEGSRRLDEGRRIRQVMPHDGFYPALAEADAPASVKLADVEEELLGHVNGKRSIADLVQLVEHDHFTTVGALHALLTTGFITVSEEPSDGAAADTGNGLSGDEAETARGIVEVFNNIFAGIHAKVVDVKGDPGRERFVATLKKQSFQKVGVFEGVSFSPDGRLPTEALLKNVATIAEEGRIQRLKGTMDRLLAQQVLQLDNSYPREQKHAVSELITREKERLPQGL
jgi:hypothetical protein